MVKRKLSEEAENFLVDYGTELLLLNRKYPESESLGERCWALELLRKSGVKRIQGLVAEFGEEDKGSR